MFRRMIAGTALTAATFAGSFALAGLYAQRMLFDTHRAARVAHAVLSSAEGRSLVAGTLSRTVASALPAASATQVGEVTRRTLADPRFDTAVETALVGVQGHLAGDRSVPTTADVAAPVRSAALAVSPHLGRELPASLTLPLPVAALPDLGLLRRPLVWVTWALTRLALFALGVAALLHPSLAAVARRAGRWALGACAVQLGVTFVLPAVLSRLWGAAGTLAAAVAHSALAGVLPISVALGIAALAALLGARLLAAAEQSGETSSSSPPPTDRMLAGDGVSAPV